MGVQPEYQDVGLITLVPEPWSDFRQTRHHVMARMARYFHVVWMTPTPGWRKMLSDSQRPGMSGSFEQPVADGPWIYTAPRTLPKMYRPEFLARLTTEKRLYQARQHLTKLGCRKIILYLWRPQFAEALDLVPHDLSVYHIDDEYSFSTTEQQIDPTETALIARVDQLFIHSESMMRKKGGLNPATKLAPNGVDFQLWSQPTIEPEDLKSIPSPRVGYIGGIKSQLDFELMLTVAKKHPDISFLFVGPMGVLGNQKKTARSLMDQPNVWHLGPKPAHDLPAYAAHFDICTMCYQKNDYTRYIYPLKLHEYLATGKPVIGTSIEALKPFGDVISLADSPEEWSSAIELSLTPEQNSEEAVASRKLVASEFDWDRLVEKMAETLTGHIYTNEAE